MNLPDWATSIGIDPDGGVYAFEGGTYWDGDSWAPVDDYDGLEYMFLGRLVDDADMPVEFSETDARRLGGDLYTPPSDDICVFDDALPMFGFREDNDPDLEMDGRLDAYAKLHPNGPPVLFVEHGDGYTTTVLIGDDPENLVRIPHVSVAQAVLLIQAALALRPETQVAVNPRVEFYATELRGLSTTPYTPSMKLYADGRMEATNAAIGA